MTMRLLLISSSNVHGYGYLDHAEPEIRSFMSGVKTIAFVPFAIFDRDSYTAKVRERLGKLGFEVAQVKVAKDLDADAIFVGGGNTFRLLKTLYDLKLLDPIRQRAKSGTPYMGSSAGSVIAASTIRTTNDMPIVQPPSLDALGLVPYQINGHYIDADPSSTHMGETRELRLAEYLEENTAPVIGIREGTMLRVDDDVTTVKGTKPAKVFRRGEAAVDIPPGTRLTRGLTVVGRGS
jgi:dipeptidase E